MSNELNNQFENPIEKKGQQIFANIENSGASLFNKDWWYGKIMDWSMKNSQFKTQMFRFVDVLPTLNSGKEVAKHLKEYFAEGGEQLPSVFNFGLGLGSLAPGLMAGTIKSNITQMAKMFITGENYKEALPKILKARKEKMTFTVDILGEACLSESESEEYFKRYIELMEGLAKESNAWEKVDELDTDHLGDIPKVNVSIKLTALYSQIHGEAWDESKENIKKRLRPIFDCAIKNNIFINIDMEKYELKDLTLEVFKEVLLEPAYRSYRHFGIVIQAYLRDSKNDIEQLIKFAKSREQSFSIRLVKGAYWDYENIGAQQKGWPIPVYTKKVESDANYEACTKILLDNYKYISLCVASHNVRSIANALVEADKRGIPKKYIEIQMLYGMAEPIKKAIVKDGYRLREYCPVGELIPGMSYLVRRLLENTSNESFLRSKFADNFDNKALLKDPSLGLEPSDPMAYNKEDKFYNVAPIDFGIKENREEMFTAFKNFKTKKMEKKVPVILDGKEEYCSDTLNSINPSNKETLAQVSMATIDQAEKAIISSKKAFSAWAKVDPHERATFLEKAAEYLLRDRFEIMVVEVLEAGKTWKEADGDVCEAVDFLNYYARQMRQLGKPFRTGHAPGEISMYQYQGRGVNLVIAPWNFPLAIITGMVGGALVTGNTVIMKPAEQTSLTALYLYNAFKEAGLPSNVLQFLPGRGEVVGEYLVKHKDTAMICFTGSKEVGQKILSHAQTFQPGQQQIKRCMTELGGKNAIIIDSDADLDEAVSSILYSSFGFQGQKCSACSRLIVLDEIYNKLIERLVEAAKSFKVGPAENPTSYMGPVIDEEAYKRILNYIEIGKSEAKLLFKGDAPTEGYFVAPHIFIDVKTNHRIAQEEIFGPVLAIIKCKDLDEALEIANGTEFGLTGGLFSRSPQNIERVKNEFNVGNLYINRGNTGAMVERHPFGGFKMSGGGSKTGGKDYLLQFVDPKVITENTLRRGFAPEE